MPAHTHVTELPASAWGWLAGYSVVVIAASLLGGAIPGKLRLTHPRMQHVISLVAGLMLGVAMLHLLPHAMVSGPDGLSADAACGWALAGVLGMFLLLRAFHFHVHEPASLLEDEPGSPGPLVVPHKCDSPGHSHNHDATPSGRLGWAGMFFGMAVHTMADGAALGAAIGSGLSHAGAAAFPGLGILVAVALHKPLDALSVTALMQRDGWAAKWQNAANVALAVLCPLGAAIVLWGQTGGPSLPMGPVLAFSAGVFLCIALADLLPEMEFHSHDRFTLTIAIMAGIALAYAIRFLEPAHVHG